MNAIGQLLNDIALALLHRIQVQRYVRDLDAVIAEIGAGPVIKFG